LDDVLIGILAILVGLLFCFRGYLAMRVVIPIWGGFTGFLLGAGLVDAFTEEGFLGSLFGWLVGLGVGVLFALFAYLYYEVAVLLTMAAIGFTLGSTLLVALGVTWNWVIVLGGIVVAVALSLVALVGDLPMALLTVLTALAGSSAVVTGVMLVFGIIDLEDFDSVATTERLSEEWWWYILYLGLAITGIVVQLRSTEQMRATLRASWAPSGGRHIEMA
jgi:hypothetical protein